jgi:hypothetical protein
MIDAQGIYAVGLFIKASAEFYFFIVYQACEDFDPNTNPELYE